MNSPELTNSKKIMIYIPVIICLVLLSLSLLMDIYQKQDPQYWLQRSGSVITVLGAWISFYLDDKSIDFNEEMGVLNMYTNKGYKILSLIIVFIGTLLWGYGDLVFKLVL
ncbi:hypothetical protein [Aliivibrio fischeri]|uniref:Uncharacterized protein n=1 Tax=Aliivibrio fischeri SR5 TaxID=1088719 RepID=A0AAV3EMA6_ALIFS|nr:hypothetical protein [Aliivibrio fischeri]EHN67932.1 hypothetical protein VFSR5_2749 [Aliivibrio fischeri SR5]